MPLVLPNGVTVDSRTNVTWSVSKDETIAPWNTVLKCVGVVVLVAVAIALIPETGGGSVVVLCGA